MGTNVTATGSRQQGKASGWLRLGLRVAGAALLAVSAGIHLDLYLTGYKSIPTIGWLFLLQVIAGFAVAAAALLSRLAAAAGAVFALSTLGGYLLSVWGGLFGFKEVRTTAGIVAGLIEVAAFAVLATAAVIPAPAGQDGGPASIGARVLTRVQGAIPAAMSAVGAVSVLAVVLLGVAVAGAGGPPAPASGGGASVTLKTAKISGVTVLTNASGLTLYWFAPDTATTSKCSGSCAAYWPPVTGNPKGGPGVTGKLGTISRPGGAVQATYNGHPLYTYVGDSAPGQARGNNLKLNGGLWYEVRVSG